MNYQQIEKANRFKSYHFGSKLLLLPNAWDAGSAKCIELSGAKALGTTSAGIAYSLGFADGECLDRDAFLTAIERIVNAVDIPVSVDIEAGYGRDINAICDTVQHIIDIGAIGINIEDSIPHENEELFNINEQVERIHAICELAHAQIPSFFINARTDLYWSNMFDPDRRLHETIQRLQAYQNAGANGLFLPGVVDVNIIETVIKYISLPLNILGGSWINHVNDLAEIGVSRISLGSGLIRWITTALQQVTEDILQRGDFSHFKEIITYENMLCRGQKFTTKPFDLLFH